MRTKSKTDERQYCEISSAEEEEEAAASYRRIPRVLMKTLRKREAESSFELRIIYVRGRESCVSRRLFFLDYFILALYANRNKKGLCKINNY